MNYGPDINLAAELDPPPRFDAVYYAALKRMNATGSTRYTGGAQQTYGPSMNLAAEVRRLREALEKMEEEAMSKVDWIAGEVMVCEHHTWRLWPDGDEGCPGPGMPMSAGESRITILEERERRLREALAPLAGAVELYRPGRRMGDPRIYTVEEQAVLSAKTLLAEEVKP